MQLLSCSLDKNVHTFAGDRRTTTYQTDPCHNNMHETAAMKPPMIHLSIVSNPPIHAELRFSVRKETAKKIAIPFHGNQHSMASRKLTCIRSAFCWNPLTTLTPITLERFQNEVLVQVMPQWPTRTRYESTRLTHYNFSKGIQR